MTIFLAVNPSPNGGLVGEPSRTEIAHHMFWEQFVPGISVLVGLLFVAGICWVAWLWLASRRHSRRLAFSFVDPQPLLGKRVVVIMSKEFRSRFGSRVCRRLAGLGAESVSMGVGVVSGSYTLSMRQRSLPRTSRPIRYLAKRTSENPQGRLILDEEGIPTQFSVDVYNKRGEQMENTIKFEEFVRSESGLALALDHVVYLAKNRIVSETLKKKLGYLRHAA